MQRKFLYERIALQSSPRTVQGPGRPDDSLNSVGISCSKDGKYVAVWAKGGSIVYIYGFQSETLAPISTFNTASIAESTHEAHFGGVARCVWSPDSEKLGIATEKGPIWIVNAYGNVLSFAGEGSPFFGTDYPAVEFWDSSYLIVLTRSKKVYTVAVDGSRRPWQIATVSSWHGTVRNCCCVENKGNLIVVGDGPVDEHQGNAGNPNLSTPQGITVSVWNIPSDLQKASLLFALGRKPQRSFMSSFFSSTDPSYPPLIISPSQSGEIAAIAPTFGALKILSLDEKMFVAPKSVERGMERVVVGVQDVDWLSENCLGLIGENGGAVLTSFPGFDHLVSEEFDLHAKLAIPRLGKVSCVFVAEPLLGKDRSMHGWNVSGLIQRSPDEMLSILLRDGKENSAMELARDYHLNTDRVYAALWQKSTPNKDSIANSLDKMSDRAVVVRECLERVADNCVDEKALLEFGLEETGRNLRVVMDETGRSVVRTSSRGSASAWYLLKRLTLLGSLDRLETFLEVHSGGYDPKAFLLFRDSNLVDVAVAFAGMGNLKALHVLFKRHAWTLTPHNLSILSNLPELMDPKKYKELLPTPGQSIQQTVPNTREKDECETVQTIDYLQTEQGMSDLTPGTPPVTEHMATELYDCTLEDSVKQGDLEMWYLARADAIDATTGQLNVVQSLLEVGVEQGVQGKVLDLLRDVKTLVNLTKTGGNVWDVDLTVFSKKSDIEKFEFVLRDVDEGGVGSRLVPLLDGRDRQEVDKLLSEFLCKEFEQRPGWTVGVLETGQMGGELWGKTKEGILSYVHCITSIVESTSHKQEWEKLDAVLSFARSALGSVPSSKLGCEVERELDQESVKSEGWDSGGFEDVLDQDYSHQVDQMDHKDAIVEEILGHVSELDRIVVVGRVLAKYGVFVTVQEVKDLNRDSTLKVVRTMLAKVSRTGKNWGNAKWEELSGDLAAVSDAVRVSVEKDEVSKELCRALLRAGKFSMARKHLDPEVQSDIDTDAAEALVMSVGREFLYSAPSLDSEAISDARQCFQLFPNSQPALLELNALQALNLLPELGLNILPLQLKQLPRRIDLIPYILKARPSNYRNLDALRSVADLLDLDASDHIEVNIMIGEASLEVGDFSVAGEIAELLCQKDVPKRCWELCAKVGGASMSDLGVEARRKLLSFAVAHCPDDRLVELTAKLKECLESDDAGSSLVSQAPQQVFKQALLSSPSPLPVNTDLLSLGDTSFALAALIQSPQEIGPTSSMSSFKSFERSTTLHLASILVKSQMNSKPLEELVQMSIAELLNLVRESKDKVLEGGEELYSRLTAGQDARQIKVKMPGLDVMCFAEGNGEYRRKMILELASYAGEYLALSHPDKVETSDQMLRESWALGEKYGVDRWDLTAGFLGSVLLSVPQITQETERVVGSHIGEVLERPQGLLRRLWNEVWFELPGDDMSKLCFVLGLIRQAVQALEMGNHGFGSFDFSWCETYLFQVQSTIQRLEEVLYGVEIKLIVHAFIRTLLVPLDVVQETDGTDEGLKELFRVVKSDTVTELADLVECLLWEFQERVGEGQMPALTVSKVYVCLVFREALCGDQEPRLLSEDFWTLILQKMTANDALSTLEYLFLGKETDPLPPEVLSTVQRKADLSLSVKIAGLQAGVGVLENEIGVSGNRVANLVHELRKSTALESAQRLAGLTSGEFDALVNVGNAGVERMIRQLLSSGCRLDVIVEVAGSTAQSTGESDVPEKVCEIVLSRFRIALESLDSDGLGIVKGTLDCLDVDSGSTVQSTGLILESLRELVWSTLSEFCSGVDDDSLENAKVVEVLDIHTSLQQGDIWAGWSKEGLVSNDSIKAKRLYSQMHAILEDDLELEYSWEDLVDLQQASQLFERICDAECDPGRVIEVLETVWESGLVWEEPDNACAGIGIVPLHSCWFSLLTRLVDSGGMSKALGCLDRVRGKKRDSSGVLSLLSPDNAELVVQLIEEKSKRDAVCAGLMLPFETAQQSALDAVVDLPESACDAHVLALLLDGGWLLNFVDTPVFSVFLAGLKQAAPHPSLVQFWEQCESLAKMNPPESPSQSLEDQYGDLRLADELEIASGLDRDVTWGGEWNEEWNEDNNRHQDDQHEAGVGVRGFGDPLNAVQDMSQGQEESVGEVGDLDAGSGWGDMDNEEFEDTLRDVEQIGVGQDMTPERDQSSPLESVGELGDLDAGNGWGDMDNEDFEDTLRAVEHRGGESSSDPVNVSQEMTPVRDQSRNLESVNELGDLDAGSGWGNDSNEAFEDTLKAVEQSAVGQSSSDPVNVSQEIAPVRDEPGNLDSVGELGDLDAGSGWGNDSNEDFEDTLRGVEQGGVGQGPSDPLNAPQDTSTAQDQLEKDESVDEIDAGSGWGDDDQDDFEDTLRAVGATSNGQVSTDPVNIVPDTTLEQDQSRTKDSVGELGDLDAGNGWGNDSNDDFEDTLRGVEQSVVGESSSDPVNASQDITPLQAQPRDLDSVGELEELDAGNGWGNDSNDDFEATLRAVEDGVGESSCDPVNALQDIIQGQAQPRDLDAVGELEELDAGNGWGDDRIDDFEDTLRAVEQSEVDDGTGVVNDAVQNPERVASGSGWGEEDNGDFEQTLEAATASAEPAHDDAFDEPGSSSIAQDNVESRQEELNAVASRVAELGLEPGVGDPGSGNDIGWDDSDEEDWNETLRTAEQGTSDPPQQDQTYQVVDQTNPPVVNRTVEEEGWSEGDDLDDILQDVDQPGTSSHTDSAAGQGQGGEADPPAVGGSRREADGDPVESDVPRLALRGGAYEDDIDSCGVVSEGWGSGLSDELNAVDDDDDCADAGDLEDYRLICSCVLPSLVAVLCQGGWFGIASVLVSEKMRLHSGLGSLEGALVVLDKYLDLVGSTRTEDSTGDWDLDRMRIPYTMGQLVEQLQGRCQEALIRLRNECEEK